MPAGNCSFTADPRFTQLLESRGIRRPTRDQAFGLMAVNVRREMIDAIAAAHYPTPSVDDLMGLAALGVNGAYIGEMARAGYRPTSIDALIQFKALNITPQWIAGFVRIGYANLPGRRAGAAQGAGHHARISSLASIASAIAACRSIRWSS